MWPRYTSDPYVHKWAQTKIPVMTMNGDLDVQTPIESARDFETKLRQARKFLESGHTVRVQLMYRRRELRRPEMGLKVFEKFAEELSDTAHVESRSPMEGRFATMVLAPRKQSERKKKAAESRGSEAAGG